MKRYQRRRRAGDTSPQVPRTASPDYVARLQTDLRTSQKACAEIVDIIEDVDRRCMFADGDVPPTLEVMTQAEISRIFELAKRGRGTTAVAALGESIEKPKAAGDPVVRIAEVTSAVAGMRALTIWEPYASLLLVPGPTGKRIETRPVPTKHRGPLAIHAGLHKFSGGSVYDTAMLDKLCRAFGYGREGVLTHIAQLPRGVVIGEVDLVACARVEHVDVGSDTVRVYLKLDDGKTSVKVISRTELAFGNYEPGRYLYITERPRRYPAPIPARGMQGVWTWRRA